ncbi:MAG: hypothetical protein HN794_00895 [Euryarchaeota archaeon]|jgi:hypothetical protein|nr:hypothetical protein [Euryarchaeota archaeon]MBT4924556.1 hypothetical protein [Euryarchaeota archaeon]MBT5735939.1 hypothetical protein [Euryarchaeota archaeon]MBT7459584.1 hypothetical protein [Euryarchaeota archaeon]
MTNELEVDGLVTLQERMVNLINQLQMPLIEVSMVIGNHIKQLMNSLNEHIVNTGAVFPEKVTAHWPLSNNSNTASENKMDLDKIISIVDDDRMDILATLIRVTLIETEMALDDGILALRMWEQLARSQLSLASSPGQLFSPIILPEEW